MSTQTQPDDSTHRPRVLAIDAGGTMTDTFIVDEAGSFVVGKAQTTPDDESAGFMRSAHDALAQWDTDVDAAFPQIASGIFSGTAMLNRLLCRQGLRVGAIVTAGHEDTLRIERAIQTHLGYPYGDRLHVATHHHLDAIDVDGAASRLQSSLVCRATLGDCADQCAASRLPGNSACAASRRAA